MITQNTKKSANLSDITAKLLTVFDGLCDGSIEAKEAVEINNTAGKLIASAKTQLVYFALRGERPSIDFIGGGISVIEHLTVSQANKAALSDATGVVQ